MPLARRHDQAVAYLEQALAITTAPADRAPLLDRAADAASVAARPSEEYARGAIEAYRQLHDLVGALAATGRLGKLLIDGGEINKAMDVLEAAVTEGESTGDEPTLAGILATLARAHMRLGQDNESIAVADRALGIAERLNLEPVVAEAIVNKGAALSHLGRRREAIALGEAGLGMAAKLPSRNFEMRARNNLAAALGDDDPVRATQLTVDSAKLAQEIGDRGMYYWLTAMGTYGLRSEAREWDESVEQLREAFESATVRSDRIRLRSYCVMFEAARGENLEATVAELDEILGDSTDPDDQVQVIYASAYTLMVAGDPDAAYRRAIKPEGLATQYADGARGLALRAAIWSGDLERISTAGALVEQGRSSGPIGLAFRTAGRAAVALAEGRADAGRDAIREAIQGLDELGQFFDAAEMALDALILMPSDPEIRRLAEERRRVFERVGALQLLAKLDATLESVSKGSPAAAAIAVEAPASGS